MSECIRIIENFKVIKVISLAKCRKNKHTHTHARTHTYMNCMNVKVKYKVNKSKCHRGMGHYHKTLVAYIRHRIARMIT